MVKDMLLRPGSVEERRMDTGDPSEDLPPGLSTERRREGDGARSDEDSSSGLGMSSSTTMALRRPDRCPPENPCVQAGE